MFVRRVVTRYAPEAAAGARRGVAAALLRSRPAVASARALVASAGARAFASTAVGGGAPLADPAAAPDGGVGAAACDDVDDDGGDGDGDGDMEEMFVDTAMGREWGGPRRGGRMLEPTRFGDWERKGRTSDF